MRGPIHVSKREHCFATDTRTALLVGIVHVVDDAANKTCVARFVYKRTFGLDLDK